MAFPDVGRALFQTALYRQAIHKDKQSAEQLMAEAWKETRRSKRTIGKLTELIAELERERDDLLTKVEALTARAEAAEQRTGAPNLFRAACIKLVASLPHTSSSQLTLLWHLELALGERRCAIEATVTPTRKAMVRTTDRSRAREDAARPAAPRLPPTKKAAARLHSPQGKPRRARVTTIVEGAGSGSEDDEPDGFFNGAAALLREPSGVVCLADGALLITDICNHRILRASCDGGALSTLAGGVVGFADGAGGDARFNEPSAAALDASGRLIVVDSGNHRVRAVAMDGTVTTLAGSGEQGGRDGPVSDAQFDNPHGISIARDGAIYVTDDHRVRVIDPARGTVSTLAGSDDPGFRDGSRHQAMFTDPRGLAFGADGALYVAEVRSSVFCEWDIEPLQVTADPHAPTARRSVTTACGASTARARSPRSPATARFVTTMAPWPPRGSRCRATSWRRRTDSCTWPTAGTTGCARSRGASSARCSSAAMARRSLFLARCTSTRRGLDLAYHTRIAPSTPPPPNSE